MLAADKARSNEILALYYRIQTVVITDISQQGLSLILVSQLIELQTISS